MKKDKEKEKEKELGKKEKKDKKEKKERMSQAELKSLEEMSIRRGFFHLNRGSSKRDPRCRLEISSPIPIKVASNTELNLTDLDAERLSNTLEQDNDQGDGGTSGENLRGSEVGLHRSSVKERAAKFGELAKVSSGVSFSLKIKEEDGPATSDLPGRIRTTSSVKYHLSLKGTDVAHVPEMVEKTFPGADLQLPLVVPPPIPDPRELDLQRRPTGDFGFSLRRTTMLDRQPDGEVCRRVVHFAEPGAGAKDRVAGLVPGDRLVEINGVNVENKSRDEIVEMIRQSGETVRLKVQTILELSELNRSWLRAAEGQRRSTSHVSPALLLLLQATPGTHRARKASVARATELFTKTSIHLFQREEENLRPLRHSSCFKKQSGPIFDSFSHFYFSSKPSVKLPCMMDI